MVVEELFGMEPENSNSIASTETAVNASETEGIADYSPDYYTASATKTAMNPSRINNDDNHKVQQEKNQNQVNEVLSMSAGDRTAAKKSFLILASIFVSSLIAMCYVCMIFPDLNESEKSHIKIPRDIQDAKMLAKVLDRYKDMYYFEVMFGIVLSYIFLQTFAIPGSLFLSILLGFLYKFPIALFLICFCSTLGATLCYCLSNLVGRRLICHFWPKKTSEWSERVDQHRDSLFNYILFLRMTPILPNWFINLASPVIGVPMSTFALSTFCGVAPPSVIAIQAGKTLQKMSSSSEAFSWTSIGVLSLCACLSLVPSLLKNKLNKKLQ